MSAPPGLILRAPRPDDAEAIAELFGLPGNLAGSVRLPFPSLAEAREELEDKPGRHVIIGELDGRPIAWAWIKRGVGRLAHSGELEIAVHDDLAGRGIGRALMVALIDLADNWLGLVRLHLLVFAHNTPAIRLYESMGFEREGLLRAEALHQGRLRDTYVMARLRPPPGYEGAAR